MTNNEDLQDILNQIFAAEKNFTFEVVRDWQKRFPQFANQIADAVANWREFQFLALEDAEIIESKEVSADISNAMEKALSQFFPPPSETIENLREFAEKKGITRESLRNIVGGSETLLKRIERRSIKEIKQSMLRQFAELLTVSTESMQRFFDLPPILSPTARYKSKVLPQTQPKQSFADAVKNDPELTEGQKRELLNS